MNIQCTIVELVCEGLGRYQLSTRNTLEPCQIQGMCNSEYSLRGCVGPIRTEFTLATMFSPLTELVLPCASMTSH